MKKLLTFVLSILAVFTLVGCQEADQVNKNLRTQEGNFEIYRQVTVINLRSDKILLEVEGYLNIDIDNDGDLNVTIMTGPKQYMLHYVSLAGEVVYVSQQLENATTNPYNWEIRIFAVLPEIQLGR